MSRIMMATGHIGDFLFTAKIVVRKGDDMKYFTFKNTIFVCKHCNKDWVNVNYLNAYGEVQLKCLKCGVKEKF
jgi:hypothetical protein